MLNTTTLPQTAEELTGLVTGYRARIEFLEERVRFLKKELFGRKSEKRPQESEGRQFELVNEAEALAEKPAEAETLVVPEHTRLKPKRKPLSENLPRVEVIHDLGEEEKVCACGAHLSHVGPEVSERLDIVPAKMQVIRHIRCKFACESCEGVEREGLTATIALSPVWITRTSNRG